MRLHLSCVRDRIGDSVQSSKLITVVGISVIALFPVVLAFVRVSRTVIPLLLIGWLSLWLRHKRWREMGLGRPRYWPQVALLGRAIAVAGVYLSEKVVSPFLLRLTGETQPQAIELASLRGNPPYLVFLLVGIWLLAAIGEELVYRGYVLSRLVDLLGRGKAGWGVGLIVSSPMFALGHGIFSRAVVVGGFLLGLIEGGLYLASRRNLWLSIVAARGSAPRRYAASRPKTLSEVANES